MQTIADEGADTYYSGALADDIVLDLKDKGLFVMDCIGFQLAIDKYYWLHIL